MPPGGLHIRWPDAPLEQEARLMDYKWYAALAYVRANRLNHNVIEGPNDRFGIIASGKAYNDTRQALPTWAWTTTPAASWASGCTRSTWCGRWRPPSRATSPPACRRSWWSRKSARSSNTSSRKSSTTGGPTCAPTCWASSTRRGRGHRRRMVHAQPQPELAAARQGRPDAGHHRQGHAQRLKRWACPATSRAHGRALAVMDAKERDAGAALKGTPATAALVLQRLPAQHQHARARGLARHGRHRLPLHGHLDGPQHQHLHQMGGEGVPWVGQQPFSTDQHMFANLGDGTYFHSGCWPSARASRRA
jgi:indolepyruvate ferredoxin oxidoreductase